MKLGTSLVVGLLLALALLQTPTIEADPEAGANPNGNLANMDGRVNPANVSGQVINGTIGHLLIQVQASGTYTLWNPAVTTSWNLLSENQQLLFKEIGLSPGWWTLKDALGQIVTQFEALDYNNTFVGVQPHQVLLVPTGVLTNCNALFDCYGPYKTQNLVFNSNSVPKCSATGTNDANQTVTVELGENNKVTYQTNIRWLAGLGDAVRFTHEKRAVAQSLSTDAYEYVLHVNTLRVGVGEGAAQDMESYTLFSIVNGGRLWDYDKGSCQPVPGFTNTYTDELLFYASG